MRSIILAGAVLLSVLALPFSRVIGAYLGKTTADQFSIGETEEHWPKSSAKWSDKYNRNCP
jgi:hypothetical protein